MAILVKIFYDQIWLQLQWPTIGPKWALPLLIYLRTAIANALVAIVTVSATDDNDDDDDDNDDCSVLLIFAFALFALPPSCHLDYYQINLMCAHSRD